LSAFTDLVVTFCLQAQKEYPKNNDQRQHALPLKYISNTIQLKKYLCNNFPLVQLLDIFRAIVQFVEDPNQICIEILFLLLLFEFQ